MRAMAALIARLVFRLEAHGQEHVPRKGPALLVANHRSFLDPFVVGASAPRPLHFLAKRELFGVPILGPMIRWLHALPVHRAGADPKWLRLALRVIEEGNVLLVFPEGTRGREEEFLEGKGGAGMLAVLSGAPVIPVYIAGSGKALPRGKFLPRPAKILVRFGPPLRFAEHGNGRRKFRSVEVSREMMAAIARLKAESSGGVAELRAVQSGARSGLVSRTGLLVKKRVYST